MPGKRAMAEHISSRQLSAEKLNDSNVYSLEFDGASKGNPGKAGAGAILKGPDGSVLCKLTKGVGIATCNFAEYQALIIGLQAALDRGVQHIKVQGDSKLVCHQVMGDWKVSSKNLSTSFAEAMKLRREFRSFSIQHVYRASNSAADALANTAIRLSEDKLFSSSHASADPSVHCITSPYPSITPRVFQEAKENFYRMEYHGGSSDKHGKVGIGALLYSPDGLLQVEIRQRHELASRNVAHYQALVIGLQAALKHDVSHINIHGDSLLIFKQMTGQRKVKDKNLLALWKEANALLSKFTAYSINHVEKVQNASARALSKAAMGSLDNHSIGLGTSKWNMLPDMGGALASHVGSKISRNMDSNRMQRPIKSSFGAIMSFSVMNYCSQSFPFFLSKSCCQQGSRGLTHPPWVSSIRSCVVMSKCLPLYAASTSLVANTSIHTFRRLLPSVKLRCFPHILQSSFLHIAGSLPRLAFSTLPLR